MNAAEMLLFFQLQSMNQVWLDNSKSETGKSDQSQALLFAALLEAALSDQSKGLSNNSFSSRTPMVTGKDVTNATSKSMDKPELEQLIAEVGQRYKVDANLIRQVVLAESSFDSKAVSPAGAMGLMQLMPETARSYGVNNPLDPLQNLEGGTRFLRDLLDRFNGNLPLALAGYNAGPGAVDKYNGIPPYRETQNYVNKILKGIGTFNTQV
jgi:soluble lytic murein transglycosylase-like protein